MITVDSEVKKISPTLSRMFAEAAVRLTNKVFQEPDYKAGVGVIDGLEPTRRVQTILLITREVTSHTQPRHIANLWQDAVIMALCEFISGVVSDRVAGHADQRAVWERTICLNERVPWYKQNTVSLEGRLARIRERFLNTYWRWADEVESSWRPLRDEADQMPPAFWSFQLPHIGESEMQALRAEVQSRATASISRPPAVRASHPQPTLRARRVVRI